MTQLAATALKAVIDQLDTLDYVFNQELTDDLSPEERKTVKHVRLCCVAERLSTLGFVLEEQGDPTATREGIKQFYDECLNRLFLSNVLGELHCSDLVRDLRKFAEGHLPLLEGAKH